MDENTVLFPAGHALVLQHVELRTQRFISCTQEAESVCALAVAPSKKHVAVAERADRATITVYDLQSLKRRKVLTFPESKTKVASKQPHKQNQWGSSLPDTFHFAGNYQPGI